jgi:hypothetical protein
MPPSTEDIREHAQNQKAPRFTAEHYDYQKQAWVGADGRYLCCAHPAWMNCQCYGRLHYGELAR